MKIALEEHFVIPGFHDYLAVNAGAKLHRLAGGKMHQRGGGEAPEDGFVWRALRLGWIVGRRVGVVAA